MLLALVEQDLRDGRGIVVIDPKGDLVDDILARVPDERLDDVVVLDPTDLERPVGLNPLAGPTDAALRADFLLGIFHRLFAASWGPRTSDILHASLLTLASTPQASLVALPVLLQDAAFRRRLVGRLHDLLGVSSFWGWYEAQSEEARAQAVAPVMNKLRAVLMRPGLRNVLGQTKPRFHLGSVFTDRKVLLVSLARGAMGSETASLFGSLVVGAIWQTALQRGCISAERRSTVSWVIDEWQTVVQLDDLADVLATSRSLGLALTLANQHLGQLPADLRSAALANARSKVCFRLPPEDASVMARGSAVLKPEDFQGLGAFETYVSLVAGGQVTPWASGRTRPASQPLRTAAELRRRSAERFGTPRAEVDAELQALLSGGAPGNGTAIGRKRRTAPGGDS